MTNRWYEYGAKFRWTQHCLPWKQELTPSCDLKVYMKQFICIWIPTKRAGLWTHMEYLNCCNHLWVLRLELNNMYENEWKDPDLLASNRDSFWCDSIIWYDAIPAYITMVGSLWFSFQDFSQRGLYWIVHNDDDFCPWVFPMGFLGLYFSVQSKTKTVSWALVFRVGLRGVFDGTVDGLLA